MSLDIRVQVKDLVESYQWDSWDESQGRTIADKIINIVVESCYFAARGTDNLHNKGNSQMYWKGRADAATDVRKLKENS